MVYINFNILFFSLIFIFYGIYFIHQDLDFFVNSWKLNKLNIVTKELVSLEN
jgi:hypothetical protein